MTQTDGKDPGVEVDALRAELAATRARVAELEEWFEVAFEHAPVAMAVVSAKENRYVRVNRALEELLGQPREYILQVDPFSFLQRFTHPDDLGEDQAIFGELALGKRRWYQVQKRYLRPDGSMRWGHLFVSGAFDGIARPGLPLGALRFVVTHIFDITEQKTLQTEVARREAELRHAQRIEAIGRLAGGVAHDFNNLLTVIAGHGHILRELADGDPSVPTSEVRDNVEPILAAVARAATLTTQLLAQGRREMVTPRALPLSDAVATMKQLLARVIGSNIEIEAALVATGWVHADQGQIGQVVMNLVLNARDAMPDGGVMTIETRDDGERVVLSVADTGHGMSEEVKARAFEAFFTTRADRPGTQGTGLGLTTVQRIVQEAGGTIAIASEPGRGTRVTVSLPRVAAAQASEEKGSADKGARPSARGERVLVVEDESSVRALVASVLVGAHYDVTAAKNGEEALRFIAEADKPFDLVVTDLVMARVGGAALARELAKRGGTRPRMLFISGYSDDALAELAPHGELLKKPFGPSELLAAVRRALDAPPAPVGEGA